MDTLTKQERSRVMGRIRGKNTKPEILLRKYLFSMGFRFRVHARGLPGHPDIVLPKFRTVIFVHGCFWHQHPGCKYAGLPKTRVDFWMAKFERNRERDMRKVAELESLGWKVLVMWECEMRQDMSAADRLVAEMTGCYPRPANPGWAKPYGRVAEHGRKLKRSSGRPHGESG